MKHLILSVFISIIPVITSAQVYSNAAGIKAGYSSGITFKHFVDREFAIEAQALYNSHGFQLSAFYEYDYSPHPKDRLHYFAGGGAYSGNWDNEFAVGVSILLGSEFIFRKAPLILGLEWKPMVNLYKQSAFAIPDLALSAKVVLN